MTVKKGIFIVIGILLIVWGIYAISLGNKGLGSLDVYTGKLNILSGAEDPDFDIYVSSPVLIRKVEMYQFVKDAYGYGSLYPNAQTITILENNEAIKLAFSSDHTSYVTGKKEGSDTTVGYDNPPMPDEPKGKIFYGEVTIGDEGILLSDEFLEKLSYRSYSHFESETEIYPVSGLAEGKEVFGLTPDDDFTYLSSDGDKYDLGDIRVTWYTIDPSELKDEYTVAGKLSGDILMSKDDRVFFYDYKKTAEEISQKFETSNKRVGIMLIIVGLLFIAIPIVKIYFGNKKNNIKKRGQK